MLGAQPSQASSQSSFLEASRSPPSKNLSHVPCKFFRQGTCQAGNTCPFSHSVDSQLEQAPCKYFQKGNCKFGAKCALAHILPDGRRVNHRSLPQNYGPLQLGARNVPPDLSSNNPSALARSLNAQHNNRQPNQPQLQQPPIDVPEYGFEFGASPPADNYMSSSSRTLGPLDVPMPASLDSNGISFLARHGPIAASVPTKFGSLDISPPTSLPQQSGVDMSSMSSSHALRSLYMSAFGVDSEHAISSSYNKNGTIGSKAGHSFLANDDPNSSSSSSPPSSNTGPASISTTPAPTFNSSSSRLHSNQSHVFGVPQAPSASSGFPNRRYVSSSFPARSSIWRGSANSYNHDDEDFYGGSNGSFHASSNDYAFGGEPNGALAFEEDFVPSSLNELLTPQERHRRGSQSSISGRLGNASGAIGEGLVSSSPRTSSTHGLGESPRFGQLFHSHHSGATSAASNSANVIGSPLRYSSFGAANVNTGTLPGQEFLASTTGGSFLSSSPLASGRKFVAQTVQRPPNGRHPASSAIVIEEDEEDEAAHNRRGQPKSSEDEEEDETQFIMDEEQLDSSGSNGRRGRIDVNGELNGSFDAMDAQLSGLVLSR